MTAKPAVAANSNGRQGGLIQSIKTDGKRQRRLTEEADLPSSPTTAAANGNEG